MDAMDVLGAILGKKSGGGGLGGKILKGILTGGRSKAAPRQPAPQRQPEPQRQAPRREPQYAERPPERDDSGLGDLLNEAYGRNQRRQSAPEPKAYREDPSPMNDQALILVKAMVNAAKSDGQVDQGEQDAIVGQLGDVSQSEVTFLRNEFAAPLDTRNFCWDVPLGMEQQVYAVSLMAIDLDANSEAKYLKELAQGLRINPEICNQLHDKFQAPRIFG